MPVEIAPRIVVDPAVQHGKPVIQGTRLPVELVIGQLAASMDAAAVAADYDLQPADIQAALAYAALVLASEEVHANV
jgi:uncharacterized protein (DUF433 family)